MKEYPLEKKRIVATMAHNGAGKTSLVEAILFSNGVVERQGNVDNGSAFTDFADEERERHYTIHAAIAEVTPKDHRIQILDLPGYGDFVGDVRSGLRVADGAIVVVCAASGVEVETEKSWAYADEFKLPRVVFVNKMDREQADFMKALTQLRSLSETPVVPIQVPIGSQANLQGVVDLVRMQALYFDEKGKVSRQGEPPADMADMIEEARTMLLDAVAETDDELCMRYLEGETLKESEIVSALGSASKKGTIIPVLCGSAVKLVGIGTLVDAIINLLPSPQERGEIAAKKGKGGQEVMLAPDPNGPLASLIFKTATDPYAGRLSYLRVFSGTLHADQSPYNATKERTERACNLLHINGKTMNVIPRATVGDVVAYAKLDFSSTGDTLTYDSNKIYLEPTPLPAPMNQTAIYCLVKSDEEKLSTALGRIVEEDPSLRMVRDPVTHETVLHGMGEMQTDVVTSRLKKQFNVQVELKVPKVAYKETITAASEGSHRHKKQSGGRGQFAEVHLRLRPRGRGEGYNFVNSVVGGTIPTKFIPAVEKGIKEALVAGILTGCPVEDVEVDVFFGKDHPVDSSEMAFKIAAAMAFREIALKCNPILLEPIARMEITVPEDHMGDVIGDMNSKRGKILGMDTVKGRSTIRAVAPLSEVLRYSIDLKSIARGRGSYTMALETYEPVPFEKTQQIVAEAKAAKEAE